MSGTHFTAGWMGDLCLLVVIVPNVDFILAILILPVQLITLECYIDSTGHFDLSSHRFYWSL